jgi:hypothetical protein
MAAGAGVDDEFFRDSGAADGADAPSAVFNSGKLKSIVNQVMQHDTTIRTRLCTCMQFATRCIDSCRMLLYFTLTNSSTLLSLFPSLPFVSQATEVDAADGEPKVAPGEGKANVKPKRKGKSTAKAPGSPKAKARGKPKSKSIAPSTPKGTERTVAMKRPASASGPKKDSGPPGPTASDLEEAESGDGEGGSKSGTGGGTSSTPPDEPDFRLLRDRVKARKFNELWDAVPSPIKVAFEEVYSTWIATHLNNYV